MEYKYKKSKMTDKGMVYLSVINKKILYMYQHWLKKGKMLQILYMIVGSRNL